MEALLSLLFRAGRALVAVPVVVLTLGALAAFGYSGYLLVSVAVGIARAPADSGRFVVTEVKLADTALIGIALFIAAAGLEELFLGGLQRVHLVEHERAADARVRLAADEPLRWVARVVRVVDEHQRGGAIGLVVATRERQPRRAPAHRLRALQVVGAQDAAAQERA